MGLAAILVIGILAAAAVLVPGLLPGTNRTSSETPVSTPNPVDSVTTIRTEETPGTAVTVPTPEIPETTAPPVPTETMVIPATTTATVSATPTANASANRTLSGTKTGPAAQSNINASRPFSIGQAATDGKGQLTVDAVTWKDKMSDPTPSYAIGKKYLIVSITYENLLNGTAEVDTRSMTLKDGGGYGYDQAADVLLENPFNGKNFHPLEKRSGNLLFIVPPQATFLKLGYDFGSGNVATFQLT